MRAHAEIDQWTALVDCCHRTLRDFLGNQTDLRRERESGRGSEGVLCGEKEWEFGGERVGRWV